RPDITLLSLMLRCVDAPLWTYASHPAMESWSALGQLFPLQWEDESEDLDPRMMFFSKAYHCFVLVLSLGGVGLAATSLSFCTASASEAVTADFCSSWPATDVAIKLGSLLTIGSCGGLLHYFKSAQMQIQITEHLKESINCSGLNSHLCRQKITDGCVMALLWIAILIVRLCLYGLAVEPDAHLALTIIPHAFACASLLGACYLQVSCWRGISLTIVAFARSLLSGNLRGPAARAKWREMTGCMRQASRMYQLTSAALALTTVMVFFTALFDIHQGLMMHVLPNVVVAGSLLSSLYVAASASAHCARLPSLVSMLDDGDDEMEQEYMNLSLFLSLSEAGFFMWDTRVTLGVLQKFVYFSTAIVGTIGFQLNVLHI
ncbi:unnamed protein product, partial [Symbiodinium pilosum]